jgi:hypothetical protein
MPKLTILNGFHLAVEKGTEDEISEEGVATHDVWTIVLTDRLVHDQFRISFRRETRDEVVRQLTGGIVLAGGELPRL